MAIKPIKTLICTLVVLLIYSTNLVGEEKYTANECFEGISRATLKFNMTLDRAIFKPIAKGYRTLPVPLRIGTSNAIENLRVPFKVDIELGLNWGETHD